MFGAASEFGVKHCDIGQAIFFSCRKGIPIPSRQRNKNPDLP